MSAAARMPFGLKTNKPKTQYGSNSNGTTASNNNSISVMNWYEKQLNIYWYKRWYSFTGAPSTRSYTSAAPVCENYPSHMGRVSI